jgi:hypothetical protein
MFWCYYKAGQGYHGDYILPPSGWQSYHSIYFSNAVYVSSGGLSFLFKDSTINDNRLVKVSSVAYGRMSSGVYGVVESLQTTGFGNIYLNNIAVWAQVQSTGRRNCGRSDLYDNGPSPSSVLIQVYSDNLIKEGWNGGTHFTYPHNFWTNTYSSDNENYPPDP